MLNRIAADVWCMKTSVRRDTRPTWRRWHVHGAKIQRVTSSGEFLICARLLFWVRTVQGASVWESQMSGSWAKNNMSSSLRRADAWRVFSFEFNAAGRRKHTESGATQNPSATSPPEPVWRWNLHLTFSSSDSCSSWSAIFSSGSTTRRSPVTSSPGWIPTLAQLIPAGRCSAKKWDSTLTHRSPAAYWTANMQVSPPGVNKLMIITVSSFLVQL